ncbi:MAG TPA: T9SS type A sorting domain-containing protein, partial [Flavobacteriales bacterium]
TDNCNEFEITIVSNELVSGSCAGNIVRTYVATDACGNVSDEFVQIIHLIDEVAPVIVSQTEDFTVECGTSIDVTPAVFEDNCDDDLTISFETTSDTDGCTTWVTYIWTATDNCNNSVSATTVVTIVDTTNPYFENFPADTTISCEQEIPAVQYPDAYDNCDESVDVLVNDAIVPGDCPNSYTIFRTFRGFDDCGNQVVETQIITVVDETAPVFADGVVEFTYECDEEIDLNQPIATDNCSEVIEYAYSDTAHWTYGCTSGFIRIWTATDECGNVAYLSQYYTIVDTTAPVIAGELEITLPCDEYEGIYVTATDNCNDVTIEVTDEEHVSGSCAGVVIRVYRATDLCGNYSEFTQIIHLTDEVAPVIVSETEDFTVECGEDYNVEPPVFADNCDDSLEVSYVVNIDTDGCTTWETHIWTAVDNCDNVTTSTTVVTIVDTTAPVINSQDFETTLPCHIPAEFDTPTAYDICDDDVEVASSYEYIPGECPGEYTEIFTYTATDNCGNSSSVTYTVHHVDTEAPVMDNIPSSNEFSCDEEIPVELPTATDACSEAIVTYSDSIVNGECPNSYVIVRTFIATDECGNVSDPAYVSYYIYDNTAPEFTSTPANESYECLDWENYTAQGVTAEDNCGDVTITYEIVPVSSDNCGNGVWQVVYTATDACWNSDTISYFINVQDVTAPELSEYPSNLVIDCGTELPEAPEIWAIDNCDEFVEVTMTSTCLSGDCPEVGATPACVLKTPVLPANNPCGYEYDWAMALFGMTIEHKYYQLVPGTASMTNNGDGTLTLTGELINAMHVSLPAEDQGGFKFNVTFENELDWAGWSSQAFPTGFKADCGGVAANHEDWIYYLLSNTDGYELEGTGVYTGSYINLTHAPTNNYFGFQLGVGANNYNAENGFGGWFNYTGIFQGSYVGGAGDFAFEIDCCVEYDLERCWTAFDCSGNEVSWCQVISYRDLSTDLEGDDAPGMVVNTTTQQIAILSMAPNPTNNIAQITFSSTESERLSLQVLDMTGRVVADLYNGEVVGGAVNKVDFNANALQAGIYMMRLNSASETDVQRIQIVR